MNLRPSGYEPDELPDCSTPRHRNNAENGVALLAEANNAKRAIRLRIAL